MAGCFQVLFQSVENFRAPADRFLDRIRADRHNHEFLNVDRVVGMLAAVDDVHHRNRQSAGHGAAEVTVERKPGFFGLSLGNGEGYRQNGVGAEFAFVFGAVEVDHGLVDFDLVFGIQAGQGVVNFVVDVFNRFQNAFSAVAFFVAVTELYGFMHAGRRAGRNRRAAESAALQDNFRFNRRIAAGVKNLAGMNINNCTHFFLLN